MYLQLDNISKSYNQQMILQAVSLQVQANTTTSILGKSGCGKSTLLKIIAGITKQDSGHIYLQQNNITALPPNLRNIVYLFQEALLFPHLNVYDNIAFGLKVKKENNTSIKIKVTQLIQHLGLDNETHKMPEQLSGGQKQRVAFGRALIINPPLMLLDEPFSSLDVETRTTMQQLYKTIALQYNITALFVTHDLKESLIMGDKLAYMHNGSLTMYHTKQQFIQDAHTGVSQEISFWNSL